MYEPHIREGTDSLTDKHVNQWSAITLKLDKEVFANKHPPGQEAAFGLSNFSRSKMISALHPAHL